MRKINFIFSFLTFNHDKDLGVYLSGDGVEASIFLGKCSGIRACLCHTYYLAGMARKVL